MFWNISIYLYGEARPHNLRHVHDSATPDILTLAIYVISNSTHIKTKMLFKMQKLKKIGSVVQDSIPVQKSNPVNSDSHPFHFLRAIQTVIHE